MPTPTPTPTHDYWREQRKQLDREQRAWEQGFLAGCIITAIVGLIIFAALIITNHYWGF